MDIDPTTTPQTPTQPNFDPPTAFGPTEPATQPASAPQPLMTPQPSLPANPASPPQVFGMTGEPMTMPQEPQPTPLKKRRSLRTILIALFVLVLLGGGTALAYFKVVLPNKPENVLKSAMINSFKQNSVTAKINFEGKDNSAPAYKVEATTKANRSDKAYGMEAKATISGVSVSAEMRYVDSSAFVKVGDMSNVTDLLGAFAPDYKSTVKTLNDKVADKWFEIDSTLLQEAGLECQLKSDTQFTDSDFDIINKAYAKIPFVSVGVSTSDTVNGSAATKYQLTIDDDKGVDFFDSLKDLPVLKQADECNKTNKTSTTTGDLDISKSLTSTTSSLKDGDKTPLTVWVDNKTKLITKIAGESTAKDKQAGFTGNASVTFSYEPVTISKPEGAKPITSLIAELGTLFQNKTVLGAKIDRFVP